LERATVIEEGYVGIIELLNPKAVHLQVEAEDAADIITRLGGILSGLGYVHDDFVEATLAREASMPTGLPLSGAVNAAIPHVDLNYVKHPAVALATLKRPVIFHNMIDVEADVPVQLVIMLALDQPKSQIETLQQVAGILQKPDAVDRLMAATRVEEVLKILEGMALPA
jgi:galactitol PTS system EIIA component